MTNWKGHLAVATVAAIVLSYALIYYGYLNYPGDLLLLALGFAICLPAALAPDVDCETSKPAHWLDVIALGILGYLMIFVFEASEQNLILAAGAIIVYKVAILSLPHRGITHTLVAAGGFACVVCVVSGWNYILGAYALAGYASHLLADGEIKLL